MKTFFWISIILSGSCVSMILLYGLGRLLQLLPTWIEKAEPVAVSLVVGAMVLSFGCLILGSYRDEEVAKYIGGGIFALSVPSVALTYGSLRLLQYLLARRKKIALPKATTRVRET